MAHAPSDPHALDLPRLQAWLQATLPGFGDIQSCEKFAGGQSNPTYRLQTREAQYVLRRKPPGQLLKSAHAVDREYRVMQALAGSGVPVPRVHALCEDEAVIGSPFFLMAFVDGRIFWDGALPGQDPAFRARAYEAMVEVLAALHRVNVDAAGLADYGRPGNYFARQVARWSEQYRASETGPNPAMEALIDWLPRHLPADDGRVALIHGDYRIDNLVFHPAEPRVLALLDWELSTLGHPWADLAYQCMQLRLPHDAAIPGLGGLDRAALGIPSEEAHVRRYCELTGVDAIPDWNFYLVFSFFRLAAILQGVRKRALAGNASSRQATAYGELARPVSEMALPLL
ncbi:phosphotransferase [Ramlibacter sp. MAHUQ-53]|uniref:phosphotransferase n=1 Tax=unclassified Ramlibacter TaxID=2617605 RepID=UPI00363D761C